MSEDEKRMRCFHCGSENVELNGNLADCECGEEHDITEEIGFFNYDQEGFTSFVHFTYKELYEMMGEEESAESWHFLFTDPRNLGAAAILVIPFKDDVKQLQNAVKWMQDQLNEEPDFAESCPNCDGDIEYHIGKKEWRICSDCGATFPQTH